jgi:preprotein translocase subunit SecG
MNIFFWITIGSMVFMTLLILIQTRGASLGAGFGAGGEINTVRRGSDKTLHQLTIASAMVFAVSIILGITR